MTLINCKIELKPKWTKYCISSTNDNDNDNEKVNDINLTSKDTKLYVSVVFYKQETIKSYQNFLAKDLKDQFVGLNLKHKVRKNTTNECRNFLKPNFVEVNKLFVLVYSNQDKNSKRFKAKTYYLPEGIANNYSVIIIGKNVRDQSIDSDIKRYEEIRKSTTGQGEGYTT